MDKELLEPLRDRIDEIDSEILSLVNERARAALAVGAWRVGRGRKN